MLAGTKCSSKAEVKQDRWLGISEVSKTKAGLPQQLKEERYCEAYKYAAPGISEVKQE